MDEKEQLENLRDQIETQNEKIEFLVKQIEISETKLNSLKALVSKNSEISEELQRLTGNFHEKILEELAKNDLYYGYIEVLKITSDKNDTDDFKIVEDEYIMIITIAEQNIEKYRTSIEKMESLFGLELDNITIELPSLNIFKKVRGLEIKAKDDNYSNLNLSQFKKVESLTINDLDYEKGDERISKILNR